MALIDEVRKACRRLAPLGWRALLRRHGLDIAKADLAAELGRDLRIDSSVPGFEDFTTAGRRGIEPGLPAASLLYHAFASPDVHPTATGRPARSQAYPTLAELDAVENYVYSLRAPAAEVLADAIIAVFAYQYRPAASTAHGYHADLVFSRTGVARVGTIPAVWDGARRGFRADPPDRRGIAVTPARYGAFLAREGRRQETDPVMGRREPNDRIRTFVFPVHKLFAGRECLPGANVALDFAEYHRNDKLQRLHTAGRLKAVRGFRVSELPFVRDSTNGGDLVRLQRTGASVLVASKPRPALVRPVEQRNSVSDRAEVVRFVVPRFTDATRYATSLQIPSPGVARRAPEYANIRHRVVKSARGALTVQDMQALDEMTFTQTIEDGGYEAAHFTDETCDGALVAVVRGVPARRSLAAYSLVSAPDFFPLADQLEVASWVRRSFQNLQEHFRQGAPWPLCEGRMPANLELPRPDTPARRAFERRDETVPAIVGTRALSTRQNAPDRRKTFASFLPDSASNYFEPGWDVSLARDAGGLYFAAYGLGSPFPEDAKLCAALNSFWPAVAPDASRTFRVDWSPTAIPLMDAELGHHPDHPAVKARQVRARRGWDGEYGPFFEAVAGVEYVNYASMDRSDYVSNARKGWIDIRLTSWIDASELIRRMDALRRCIKALPSENDRVSSTKLWLISAEPVASWAADGRRARAALTGPGFVYVFALVDSGTGPPPRELTRLRARVTDRFECQVGTTELFTRTNGGPWKSA